MKRRLRMLFTGPILLLGILFLMTFQAHAAEGDVAINEKNFPDPVFREYISRKFDLNSNGKLTVKERRRVKTIRIRNSAVGTKLDPSLKSLKGIEYFPNLTSLEVYNQELKELDLRKNRKLIFLECADNYLKTLRVEKCKKLQTVYCNGNQLKKLDFSNCRSLKYLECHQNRLTELNLKGCRSLDYLCASSNRLKKVDVTAASKLRYLYVSENRLTSLDVRNNPELEYIWAYGNRLKSISVMKNPYMLKAYNEKEKDMIDTARGRYDYLAPKNQYDFYSLYVDLKVKVITSGWYQIDKDWYYYADGKNAVGWKVIDGQNYYFKKNGAMAVNEYCKGYWLDKSGVWSYKAKASWKKTQKGWMYMDTAGWYARNITLTIDGKKYSFDRKGYLIK